MHYDRIIHTRISLWHNLFMILGVCFEETEVATEQEPLPSSHEVHMYIHIYVYKNTSVTWWVWCSRHIHVQCVDNIYNCMWLLLPCLTVQSIEKKVASILPLFRVGTHAHPTIGYHCATQDGVYEILFDNTYSRYVTNDSIVWLHYLHKYVHTIIHDTPYLHVHVHVHCMYTAVDTYTCMYMYRRASPPH